MHVTSLRHGSSSEEHHRTAAFEKVLLVDDHALFAQALAGLIRQEELALSVVTVGTLEDAAEQLVHGTGVDLVLLDLALNGEAGLSLLPRLAGLRNTPPVVIISSSEDESTVRAVRTAGAAGFLAKSAGRAALVRMMQSVRRGEGHFPRGYGASGVGDPVNTTSARSADAPRPGVSQQTHLPEPGPDRTHGQNPSESDLYPTGGAQSD